MSTVVSKEDLYITKPGANPRRIGVRLVWVVR
jgi:hypothetical protein